MRQAEQFKHAQRAFNRASTSMITITCTRPTYVSTLALLALIWSSPEVPVIPEAPLCIPSTLWRK